MADVPSLALAPAPDVMNDPEYATNNGEGEDGMGDVSLCRICRGEGSDAEPLFHPCKCSGSIKYVHQDCLMEWLSHSQKKHCELCKTPFRFTKLYSPNMPKTLPLRVLFRHVLIHTAKNLATWLRFCLVVAVWLGVLPYIIRQVWRLLFWFSDGGWPTTDVLRLEKNSTGMGVLRNLQIASLAANGTSPVSPLQASQTTPAGVAGVVDVLVGMFTPVSQTLDLSSADPLAAGLFKFLVYGFGLQPMTGTSSDIQHLGNLSHTPKYSSLLSNVSFLRNLTRHSTVNELIITVAEGCIITILVVVCFILVFLIREWVVQQQPGINMGAGFNAVNAEFAAGQDRPGELQIAPEEQRQPPARPAQDEIQDQRDVGHRRMARARRRNNHHAAGGLGDEQQDDPNWEDMEEAQDDVPIPQNRPAPVRDALTPAVEIQRALTEEPRMTEEFLAIWRRADSDPKEVLRIIERENKGDQMRYWVNAMRILQNPLPNETQLSRGSPSGNRNETNIDVEISGSSNSDLIEAQPVKDQNDAIFHFKSSGSSNADSIQPASDQNSSSTNSWVDIPNSLPKRTLHPNHPYFRHYSNVENENSTRDKGKSIVRDDEDRHSPNFAHDSKRSQPPLDFTYSSGATRPRAISDGPPIVDAISPLAHNNWTFSNLPDDEEHSSGQYIKNASHSATRMTPTAEDSEDSGQDEGVPIPFAYGGTSINKSFENVEAGLGHPPASEFGVRPIVEDGPVEIIGLDGVTRTHRNWDEVFENNPIGLDSDSEEEPEPNTLYPDAPLPERQQPIVPHPAEGHGILGTVADFLWGGVGEERVRDEPGPNEERIVQDLAAEAPFVPVPHEDQFQAGGNNGNQDREVVEAAIAAGLDPNDPDAIDDAEDFEGIMELVGMRGPIFSLVQNALFSAFLLALTVAFGVWIPYNIGRVSLLLVANPGPAFKLPLRLVFGCAAFMQDLALSAVGVLSYCLLAIFCLPLQIWSYYSSSAPSIIVVGSAELGSMALNVSHGAFDRILDGTLNSLIDITDSDIFAFSAASHEALMLLRSFVVDTLVEIGSAIVYLFVGDYTTNIRGTSATSFSLLSYAWQLLAALPSFLARPESWVISLEVGKRATPLNLDLSVWGGTDRFWATTIGYSVICLLGALYVRKGTPFSSSHTGRDWEAAIIDLLNQAGGVLKVILIISIEMLVFPLYCGLLLDAALLPLFDNTTIMSRILFTVKSPLTSIFVHWFVGTCYMFHFALFVSMCRKIMRKGVLYFIRDPDDPTFHPVRDVLERNVATQLRKILFSALVYGGLVVICLGGVVWGIAFAFKGVLPIHWSSNEPVLEFPIDLLFYNFLMPLAVKFFKPSDGLHAMYTWWFRQCARMLRLTWFMFDERKLDEEGYNVHRTWGDFFRRVAGDPENKLNPEKVDQPFIEDSALRAYFHKDGRYVRAPASDQVRIPKGTRIFLEVDEQNRRVDKKRDKPDGVHGSKNEHYKHVYIPPWFKFRIFLFILFIWLFAAITGVSITIVPLVFGRYIFARLIPPHVRKNDVYAFSIGIYILGSASYAILHIGTFVSHLKSALAIDSDTPQNLLRRTAAITSRLAGTAWTYVAFLFILPTLYAFVIEMYFITPLHTYFAVEEPHVVHFVQSWTLGLLYVKLTTRLILWHRDSRPAQSLRAITARGYLNPDARLATRSFILPASFVLCSALFYPWCLAKLAVMTVLKNNPEKHLLAYRYAYPMTLCLGCISFALYILLGWLKDWRMKIRDEVYLIGERLHNFGDRKTASSGVSVPNMRRLET